MDRKVAEEQVLGLIATCFRHETKVEEGFLISLVNLTGVIRRGKRCEAFAQVPTSSSTIRSIARGMRSRWQIDFAVILPGGRFARRRGDIFVEREQGGKTDAACLSSMLAIDIYESIKPTGRSSVFIHFYPQIRQYWFFLST